MSNKVTFARLGGILTTVLMAAVPLSVAQATGGAAPVPAQIRTAKKVFISNVGTDAISTPVFIKEGEVNRPYNEFYSAIKAWGRYTLVDNPDDADQVFEIRFMASLASTDKIDTYAPELVLTIVDAKTHLTLWTLAAPVRGALRKATWDKNFSQGMTTLVDDLKRLAAPASGDQQAANR